MSVIWRRDIPRVFMVFFVLLMVLDFNITGVPILKDTSNSAKGGIVVVTAFSQVLGAIILMRHYFESAKKRKPGWQVNVYGIVLFLFMVTIGITYGVLHPWYQWVYNSMNVPLDIAGSSLLMVFIVSAGYRLFKIRNIESVLIVVTLTLTILSQVPLGEHLWRDFPLIGNWIETVPTAGAYRGIMITTAFGTIMLIIRSILGIEEGLFRRV